MFKLFKNGLIIRQLVLEAQEKVLIWLMLFWLKKRKDKKGKTLSVHFTTVNNYLKEYLGKPRKLRKVFYLSTEHVEKRCEFCRMILDKKLKPEQIFFTDESKVDLGPFTNDLIRISPKKKLDEEIYKLINRPTKKFEKSVTIAVE